MLTETILLEQNKRLREERDELLEALAQLRHDVSGGALPLPEWVPRLTPLEQSVLRLLIARNLVNTSMMQNTVHNGDARSINMLSVVVCRLRHKLEPFGIVIKTVWGKGYEMPPSSKAKLADQAMAA